MSDAVQSMGNLALQQAMSLQSSTKSGAGLDKAAQDFTGMFFSQMLQPMFEGVGVDPVFGGGHGEEVMKSFLVQEYGKIVAQRGFGLTDAVKQQMIKSQAAQMAKSASEVSASSMRGSAYDTVQ